jgi:signal transduction histidine kinase
MGWITLLVCIVAVLSVVWLSWRLRETRARLAQRAAGAQRQHEQLEKTVAAQKAELAETVQQFEAFAYSVAHDLRAPLRAIKGFTNALSEDYADTYDEQGKDFARRVVESATKMDQMIEALLAYSRAGRGEISVEKVELEELLGKLSQQWAARVQAHRAQLEIARPLPAVMASPPLLEQALTQFVTNALKFVPPGVVPRVQIRAESASDVVRIQVVDNGIGVEPRNFPKLFQVFQRLNRPDEYPGVGIGLAIVTKVVKRMNGRVGVESEPGKGSSFWLELPGAR